MLNIPFLRNILILSLLFAIGLPLFELLFTHPAYQELLIRRTEAEAVRFVNHLTALLNLGDKNFDRSTLPPELEKRVAHLTEDVRLKKFRLFSPKGEIIFSTEADEIGTINRRDYFRTIVARGGTFSKVVRKNETSADLQVFSTDVVETYVPIMPGGRFGGAVEVYSDITDTSRAFSRLHARTVGLLSALATVLLLTMMGVLVRAGREVQARENAESKLQKSHEHLENIVEERTKELSRALSETERAHRQIDGILQTMEEGLLVLDDLGKIVLINRSAEKIFGLTGVPVTGQAAASFIWHSRVLEGIETALRTGAEPDPFDFFLESRAPAKIYQCRMTVIPYAPEKVSRLIVLFYEMTREREMERMKEAFLAMAAHELHTPLSVIIGYSELLLREEGEGLSEDQEREYHHLIHEKGLHLSRIVDDLLDISRIASGRSLRLEKSPIQIGEETAKIVRQFQDRFPRHRFSLEAVDPDFRIMADPHRYHQVLDNLLDNAVKYSSPGSAIHVGIGRQDGFAMVAVTDAGVGLTAEQAEQAFDLFYRADTSDTAVQGTGLGLSISRHIVEAHDGQIWLESVPGRGTTIQFSLPESISGETGARNAG